MLAWLRLKLRFDDETEKVKDKVRKGSYESMSRAAANVRLRAYGSIRKAAKGKPSAPGKPPRTREDSKGAKRLKKSILYAVESPLEAVIGPSARIIGPVGAAHEFGGRFRGASYPARPFMAPALEKVRDRLPKHWKDSVRN